MNGDRTRSVRALQQRLGYKPLSRLWAKGEILLGLAAVGVGLMLMVRGEMFGVEAIGGLVLFVLGGYLAMAGHRSHLYQSNNELAAHLAEEIRKPSDENSGTEREPAIG